MKNTRKRHSVVAFVIGPVFACCACSSPELSRKRESSSIAAQAGWIAGAAHPEHLHVVAGSLPGEWLGAPGYQLAPTADDLFRVVWVPGLMHRDKPHLLSGKVPGRWVSNASYVPAKRVARSASSESSWWRPGRSHRTLANVVMGEKIHEWVPASGYVFDGGGRGGLRVRRLTVEEELRKMQSEPTRAAIAQLKRVTREGTLPDSTLTETAYCVLGRYPALRFKSNVDRRLRDWVKRCVRASADVVGLDQARAKRLGDVGTHRNLRLLQHGGTAVVREFMKPPAIRWGRAALRKFALLAVVDVFKSTMDTVFLKRHFNEKQGVAAHAFADVWHEFPALLATFGRDYKWQQ